MRLFRSDTAVETQQLAMPQHLPPIPSDIMSSADTVHYALGDIEIVLDSLFSINSSISSIHRSYRLEFESAQRKSDVVEGSRTVVPSRTKDEKIPARGFVLRDPLVAVMSGSKHALTESQRGEESVARCSTFRPPEKQ
jgi:hypothetical protein